MAVDFRGHPMFPTSGFSAPTRFEADVYDCEVWGEIPSDIDGTFYRMQCDFVYRPPENEWPTGFNGDGHVSMFRFRDGSVDYKSRFVQTERLKAEKAARKRLFGVYRNRLTDDPSVAHLEHSAANTHIYWHHDKLMVLKEDSLPWLIDPHTMETVGPYDFGGQYTATSMSAHPKIDYTTGEMIAYGYQARGDLSDDIAIYSFNPQGEKTWEAWIKSPYLGIIHDIAITQKYVIIPVISRTTSLERLRAGEPMWEWDSSLPTMVGVLPRGGDAKDVRWFTGPPRNTLHYLNAFDTGDGKVYMELPVGDDERSPQRIKRWIFDMNSRDDRFGEEVINESNSPLARMDDRYCGQPYQYGYVGNSDAGYDWDEAATGMAPGRATNCYVRFDIHTRATSIFNVGPVSGLQEVCFVPRSDTAPEGEGYLFGIASNYQDMVSELVIADAMRMEEGPIARVRLPFRLRGGTHGSWMPSSQMPFA